MEKITVSLTSYKERLKYVPRVIDSLLRQSLKPDRIVLNLHEEDTAFIGKKLRRILDAGLAEAAVCKDKIGPHTKYFYTMLADKQDVIITVDDDHIYHKDLIQRLFDSYRRYPDCVSAMRVHRIVWDEAGEILPYSLWERECSTELQPSFDLMATGVGGVLYPPDILKISPSNLDELKKCLTADDIYLKYLENRYRVKVVWVQNSKPYESKKIWRAQHQRKALWRINRSSKMNDEYLKLFKFKKSEDQ